MPDRSTGDNRPLYERDPDTWQAYLAEGNAKQPRKRIGADVLIRNGEGQILLVNPSYKPDWDLPGGMVEANEPPHTAAARELREELGIELNIGRLLVLDWVSPHDPWDDSLMLIFDGGTLTADDVAALRPSDNELLECRFTSPREAQDLLRPYVWHRLTQALAAADTGGCRYLVNGAPPGG